jgi:hypothetical protein
MNWIGQVDTISIDVASDMGETILARKSVGSFEVNGNVGLEFTLQRDTKLVEFRMFVGATTCCQLKAVALTRL